MADETLTEQLDREKRAVSYDMYDMTVRQLVDMVSAGEINISPDYQRHFVWDAERESELIESIYLGIPVPSLYMAANKDGTWEVVDGVQRLSTLVHFCGDLESLAKIDKKEHLQISNLKKLTSLNKKKFDQIPKSVQLNFTLRPVRVTTLNDKSDFSVRYDLFERLNTGGVKLHPQEIRNCVFRGALRDLLKDRASNENFLKVVRIPKNEQMNAIYEECVLRFFAFIERYGEFEHSVLGFLNQYMIDKAATGPSAKQIAYFNSTMDWLARAIPKGIARGARSNTPLNLYEAVAVGTALALAQRNDINPALMPEIMNSEELKKLTTGATNSRRMVAGRIEFVRNALLA